MATRIKTILKDWSVHVRLCVASCSKQHKVLQSDKLRRIESKKVLAIKQVNN